MHEAKRTEYNNNSLYQGHLFHLFGDPALPLFSSNQQVYNEFPEEITVMEQQTIQNTDYDLATLTAARIRQNEGKHLLFLLRAQRKPLSGLS